MSTRRPRVMAWVLCALWLPLATAANPPSASNPGASGAMPGDDALTCDEIYTQGMAQSQQDQQARSQHIEQMRQQNRASVAILTGATLAGGLGGTGQAAQATMEGQADRSMAMLTPPPSNARMDHLKQLWAQKHCVRH
ncbi:MAG TPA: hypothetical protein VGR63_03130 [Casimicrobiaceae bacterium]|nr:hypothetical protein [Casimicrobiaceae bacterium]